MFHSVNFECIVIKYNNTNFLIVPTKCGWPFVKSLRQWQHSWIVGFRTSIAFVILLAIQFSYPYLIHLFGRVAKSISYACCLSADSWLCDPMKVILKHELCSQHRSIPIHKYFQHTMRSQMQTTIGLHLIKSRSYRHLWILKYNRTAHYRRGYSEENYHIEEALYAMLGAGCHGTNTLIKKLSST